MKKKIAIIILILLVLLILLGISAISYATTGSFSVSTTSSNINIGESTNINITAKDCGGKFTITSSDNNIVSVNEPSKWVEEGTRKCVNNRKKGRNCNNYNYGK